jgi:cysteinyl-tRNA synthetase
MALRLFNTLTKNIEDFSPLSLQRVTLYTCGPTVYNQAHIGNFRAFLFSDTIRRTLTYLDYDVTQVMNITDIDDKTIRGAIDAHIPLTTFTENYTKLFLSDLAKMNILSPHHQPRATAHISEMMAMIEQLLAKSVAYKTEDGIYFDISKAKNYGTLIDLKLDAETKSRITSDEYTKDNPQDFALWKFWKEADGEVKWDASFGAGRPGWHIECSAMSRVFLGDTIDIHTGGIDLKFPHHTNEIAQSEGVTEKTFVRYWMHSGFVNIADEKMSKSLDNIITLDTLLEKKINPLAYRLWLLSAHYRTTINFTWDTIAGSQEAYIRLIRAIMDLKNENPKPSALKKLLSLVSTKSKSPAFTAYKDRFISALSEDLNTPQAVALIWEILGDQTLSSNDKLALLLDFDQVLGLGLKEAQNSPIPEDITKLLIERETARKAEDWAKSDTLRAQITSAGYDLLDTPKGPKIYKK